MKINNKKVGRLLKIEMHTIVAILFCCVVFLLSIANVYQNAKTESFDRLHRQAVQLKENLSQRFSSDMEKLSIVADTASILRERGESMAIAFDSYEAEGLIEGLAILLPDNSLLSEAKGVESAKVNFDNEVKKGKYISGRVPGVTYDGAEVMWSAVPIVSSGETVGILYGIVKLDTIDELCREMANDIDVQLYIYEEGNGNFVVDTVGDGLDNISDLKNKKYKKGFSYNEIINKEYGFSAYKSQIQGEDIYAHFCDFGISDWRIIISRPTSVFYRSINRMTLVPYTEFFVMVIIILLYFAVAFRFRERKREAVTQISVIRKLLLEINRKHENVEKVLKCIANFSNARSVFFIDTDNEDYHYIRPEFDKMLLCGEERQYFMEETFGIASKCGGVDGTSVNITAVCADKKLAESNPRFYEFLKRNGIEKYKIAIVADKSRNIGILGVVNPKSSGRVKILLSEISICFSIAIYNKKYLDRTKLAASTDSLTGLYNRTAYNKDIVRFDREKPTDVACVYVDINDLHYLNNLKGHTAGDEMILCVANTLKEVFFGGRIYRIGGDEFLIFVQNKSTQSVQEALEMLREKLTVFDYHVAVGMAYTDKMHSTENLVKEAENYMYKDKSRYYQNKENGSVVMNGDSGFEYIKTGIKEIDTLVRVIKGHYAGVYSVSLNTDEVNRILSPLYMNSDKDGASFSNIFKRYVAEYVYVDYRRTLLGFLNYDVLKAQLHDGEIPRIKYKKISGENMILSVYAFEHSGQYDSLWVFEKV